MDNDRVKELQDISNDFLKRLGEDEEDNIDSIKKPLKTDINDDMKSNVKIRKLNMPNFSITNLYKKEKERKVSLVRIIFLIIQSQDIFKPLKPWKPNDLMGRTLNKFQILKDGHYPSEWEKVNK